MAINDTIARPSSSALLLPVVELVVGTFTYLVIIFMTIIGNVLVILAVFNYRPLRKVQNYFLVSLAASDISVGVFVMPLHVVKFLAAGRWLLGVTVCQFFTTADILLCTSSILNLCAIAIDRYRAIHDPIGYAQKRSIRLVLGMIIVVWILSVVISVPPLIGWNDWSSQSLMEHCELTTERAFVLFSACGSFFVPLLVMVIVYVKIFLNTRQRIRTNRGRSALHRMSKQKKKSAKKPKRAYSPGVSLLAIASARALFKREKCLEKQIPNKSLSAFLTIEQQQQLSSRTSPSLADETVVVFAKRFNKTDEVSSGSHYQSAPAPNATKTQPLLLHSPVPIPKINLKSSVSSAIKIQLKEREKISVAKEKRAAKTIAVIIFAFVFCWLPFFCAYVIMPFCESCYLHPRVSQTFTWLGYINSSLNPFLYGILNVEFRRAFRKIVCPKQVR